ncbi:MAG: tRNA lysidine(34) synthetase TilS [Bacteroidetes bacterium]|nr:MAG: tRNA lysidine(34) synthetase TilS [Bacteroidota bacterium]
METIIINFNRFVEENLLFDKSKKLLVAVSGGVDSVVLCNLLWQSKFNFSIAHCNFQLRKEESLKDEYFVRQLADNYGLAFFVKHFETNKIVHQEKKSVQLVARNLRYDWFRELLENQGFDYLLTAHHQNDQSETLLYNLCKGTGIAGLHGIRLKHNKIVRPMLFANKDQILEYAHYQGLKWREDASNQTTKYSRNLIRHKIIPVFKQINPNLENSISQTVERLAAVERIFEKQMQSIENQLFSKDLQAHYLDLEFLQSQSEPLIILDYFLKPYHFSYVHCQEILQSFDKKTGKTFESSSHILVKDRKKLVITKKEIFALQSIDIQADQTEIRVSNLELKFSVLEKKDLPKTFDKENIFVDLDKIKFPLKLRKWQHGDHFCPFGMKGKTKKVSDLLTEQKIPLNLKKNIWVLCSDKKIVWVIGLRTDERFKITEKTMKILKIELKIWN